MSGADLVRVYVVSAQALTQDAETLELGKWFTRKDAEAHAERLHGTRKWRKVAVTECDETLEAQHPAHRTVRSTAAARR